MDGWCWIGLEQYGCKKRERTRALDRTKWHVLWGKPRPNLRGSQWYRRDTDAVSQWSLINSQIPKFLVKRNEDLLSVRYAKLHSVKYQVQQPATLLWFTQPANQPSPNHTNIQSEIWGSLGVVHEDPSLLTYYIMSTSKGTDVSDKAALGKDEPKDKSSIFFSNVGNYLQGGSALTSQITWFFKHLCLAASQ
jgi:hypothetical protein